MQKRSECLDPRNHARHDILSIQHALNFRLDAIPSTGGKFAKQLSVETSMNSQTFGNGKNYLPMRDWSTNIFGEHQSGADQNKFRCPSMHAGQQATNAARRCPASGGMRGRCIFACKKMRQTFYACNRNNALEQNLHADRRT
jgi:hypothetical protein